MRKDSLVRHMKSLLFIIVIGIWVTSVSILGVACWIRDNLSPIIVVAEGTTIGNFYIHSFFPNVFPVLITISCLMLVIGCVGCCGVCSDNKALLGWFFMSMLISLCVEISSGVGGRWDWNSNTEERDVALIQEKMKSREWENIEWISQAWKEMQTKFNCCDIQSLKGLESYEAIITCEESREGEMRTCSETIISFLKETKVIKALPILASIMAILQFAALIITAKLWMIACMAERQNMSNGAQLENAKVKTLPKSEIQLHPLLRNTSVQTTQSSPITIQSSTENLPMKLPTFAQSNRDYPYNERCPQCRPTMKWYDETKLMTLSRLDAEYRKLHKQNRNLARVATSRHSEELLARGSAPTGLHQLNNPIYPDYHLVKSASYNSPTDWRSPSLQSVVKGSRHCYSVSLPRRKQSYVRRQRRLNYSRNFIQRLSTIRASGVAVESDTSSEFQESDQEELGDSRCYNTEAGSSSSGDKEIFLRFERDRKMSEPSSNGEFRVRRNQSSDYTTL